MHIKTAVTRFLCLLLMLCISSSLYARIYKWVDENGVTQYTETPPPADVSAEEIKPPPKINNEDALKRLEERRSRLDKNREDRLKAAEEEKETQGLAAEKKQKCEQARARLASYQRPRINVVGDDGERRRATEDERLAGIVKAREMVDKLCN